MELQNVHYALLSDQKNLHILKACHLRVQAHESLAIIGRSGSGKSTLLALMAGLESPTEGDITLLGQPLNRLSEDQRAMVRAQQVGFIFQNFQLMPSMSALENILMPLELFQVPNARAKALAALEQVGLSHRASHRPAELSGGEQQRVAIARAFVTEPKILFADEPTGNLDEETALQIQALLFSLNRTLQTTLILVTHDIGFAKKCDRMVQLTHGQLSEYPLDHLA
jgi:putative ABC transport system ATP-binding protein